MEKQYRPGRGFVVQAVRNTGMIGVEGGKAKPWLKGGVDLYRLPTTHKKLVHMPNNLCSTEGVMVRMFGGCLDVK